MMEKKRGGNKKVRRRKEDDDKRHNINTKDIPIQDVLILKLLSRHSTLPKQKNKLQPLTMHQSIDIQISLPDDIALKIASSLQVIDVCSLGSCSRFWRDLCGSDYVWEALCKDRWCGLSDDDNNDNSWASQSESPSHGVDQEVDSNPKRWKGFYISKHIEMAGKAALVTSFVERASAYESIEVGNYLKAIELLNSLHFGFKDVQIFLLKPQINVLLNLVGLHYCINWLNVPAEYVIEAVNSSRVSERQVCVQWWKLGRWFYGFRLRDELHSRNVALGDLTACDEEVIGVLHRGAIHEVIRVRISAATTTHTSWLYQVAQA